MKILSVGLLVLILLPACTGLFFYPMKQEVLSPTQLGLQYNDIYLKTNDGVVLHGWHLPALIKRKGNVIFFHGNAENISTHIASIYWLPKQGYDVYLFDYRGYGRSEGYAEIDSVMSDAFTMLDYVVDATNKVDESDLVVFGQSLGAAIAINAAAYYPRKEKIKAVVVDSSFSGFRKIAREKFADVWLTWLFQYPFSLAFTNKYSPEKASAYISPIPLLVIHGTADTIIPLQHAKNIYQAAKAPKLFWKIERGVHIESMTMINIRENFLEFLALVVKGEIPEDYRKEVTLIAGERAKIK